MNKQIWKRLTIILFILSIHRETHTYSGGFSNHKIADQIQWDECRSKKQ